MADERGKPVEKWKLTPEQMNFQKRFRMLKQIQELLQARSMGLAIQMENEQELWQNLEGEFKKLQPPKKSLHELDGMDFKDAEGKPNYNLRY